MFVMANDPVGGFWNRTIGLGVTDPLTAEQLGQITSFATTAGAGLQVIQVAPGAQPLEWPDELAAIGAVPSATWVKFVGRPPLAYEGETSLRISKLGDGHEADYGRVMCRVRDALGVAAAGLVRGVSRPELTPYGAFDGDEPRPSLAVGRRRPPRCAVPPPCRPRGQGAQVRSWADALPTPGGRCNTSADTGSESPTTPTRRCTTCAASALPRAYTRTNYIWRAPRPEVHNDTRVVMLGAWISNGSCSPPPPAGPEAGR